MTHSLLDILRGHRAEETSQRPSVRFVDLGLPSGVLWAELDVEEPTMVGCSLPTYRQAQELMEHCEFWIRESTDGERDMCAVGPSGELISFPMREYEGTIEPAGCCWCQGDSSSSEFSYFLLLGEETMTIGLGRRTLPFPYRLVREG